MRAPQGPQASTTGGGPFGAGVVGGSCCSWQASSVLSPWAQQSQALLHGSGPAAGGSAAAPSTRFAVALRAFVASHQKIIGLGPQQALSSFGPSGEGHAASRHSRWSQSNRRSAIGESRMQSSAEGRPCGSGQLQEPAITRSNWQEHSCSAASGVVGPGGGAAGSRARRRIRQPLRAIQAQGFALPGNRDRPYGSRGILSGLT